jgi:hypothetical protein
MIGIKTPAHLLPPVPAEWRALLATWGLGVLWYGIIAWLVLLRPAGNPLRWQVLGASLLVAVNIGPALYLLWCVPREER